MCELYPVLMKPYHGIFIVTNVSTGGGIYLYKRKEMCKLKKKRIVA